MSDTPAEARSLLALYARPIAHMRSQQRARRFGLIFGAGASIPVGFPTWEDLVKRVARCPEVDGTRLTREVRKPLPIVAEVAYQRFRAKHLRSARNVSDRARDIERLLLAQWTNLVHRCLYRDTPRTPDALLRKDKVYRHFLKLVRESPLTVNYNFDDTLQRLLLHTRDTSIKETRRGFETITDSNLQYGQPTGVIYHPNGFLPRNHLERTTDKMVFNEGSFADQMIDVMVGSYTALLHHLSKTTCLLLGLSLSDETLRHLLRKSALLNPGHYHYHVEYLRKPFRGLTRTMRAQADASFDTYNLVTLFLDDTGLKALGYCLTEDDRTLRTLAEEEGVRLSYTYYFTGVPGVGKTTTLSHFKSYGTQDEWIDERLPELSKPFTQLTDAERERVDSWILDQVGRKNKLLLDAERDRGIGITIVDRCVPDAVTFTEPAGWKGKAASLLDAVAPRASRDSGRKVHPGHVILLRGDPREIRIRAATKGKKTTEDYTRALHAGLETVYGRRGVSLVDVSGMTPLQVVKEVARIIHSHPYDSCDLQRRLEQIRNGTITAPRTVREVL